LVRLDRLAKLAGRRAAWLLRLRDAAMLQPPLDGQGPGNFTWRLHLASRFCGNWPGTARFATETNVNVDAEGGRPAADFGRVFAPVTGLLVTSRWAWACYALVGRRIVSKEFPTAPGHRSGLKAGRPCAGALRFFPRAMMPADRQVLPALREQLERWGQPG